MNNRDILIGTSILSGIAAIIFIVDRFFTGPSGSGQQNQQTTKTPASGNVKTNMGNVSTPNDTTSQLINQLNQEASDESAGSTSTNPSDAGQLFMDAVSPSAPLYNGPPTIDPNQSNFTF